MADSFAGQSLNILAEPFSRKQEADISVRHIPGGNYSYVDSAGQSAKPMTFGLLFYAYTDYKNFEALVGTNGSLVYYDDTLTATLKSCQLVKRSANGYFEAQAEFITS